ncbi:MAG: hypothetical protein P4L99_21040 [Chthoniobacter sp.]|nr:hypothetical protein [Chthoniobacter sp.]
MIVPSLRSLIALGRSMPSHQDYERYKATGGGRYGTDYQRNEDYEQNQRMTTHSNTQRETARRQHRAA